MFVVNGTLWNIIDVPSTSTKLLRSDGTHTIGVTDNSDKTIYMNNSLDDFMYDRVLCHELVHVFCFEYGVYVDLPTEEIMADFMSLYGRQIIYLADSILSDVYNRTA